MNENDTNITDGEVIINEELPNNSEVVPNEVTTMQSDNTDLINFITEYFAVSKEQLFLENGTFINFINQFSLGELVISVLLFLILLTMILKIVYEVIFD